MARRYRRQRSNPLEDLGVLAIVIGVAFVWRMQHEDSNLLINVSIVAILLVVGLGGLSLWRYKQTQRKLRALDIAAIDTMDPLEFEVYIAKLLKHRGFTAIKLTERYDYGVDIVAEKGGTRWGVQVKRYSGLVKADAVRQVFTALVRYKCDRSIVVTNSVFSRPARELAADNNCVLIDRDQLSEWIVDFQTAK